jgi:hypothetical protein
MFSRILRGSVAAAGLAACLGSACALKPSARAVPSYDVFTARLVLLSADQNGDGKLDQWSYMDGDMPLRGEADTDGDGRIDRWEYFGQKAELVKIGTSSRNDGVEDTWTVPSLPNGETEVALSRRGDRLIDRREYYRGQALLRVEEDVNADGVIDKWERYEGTVLREADFDTSFHTGKPNKRVRYDAQGRLESLEGDVKP